MLAIVEGPGVQFAKAVGKKAFHSSANSTVRGWGNSHRGAWGSLAQVNGLQHVRLMSTDNSGLVSNGLEIENLETGTREVIPEIKPAFPFSKATMHVNRPGVSVNLADAVANYRELNQRFESKIKEQKAIMSSQVISGWLNSVKGLYGRTEEGQKALQIIQQRYMGDLYLGAVDRAVLKLASDTSLSASVRKTGLMALQTLKTLQDRTLTLAATRVVKEDFYKGVKRWDPISAIAFLDVTNAKVKVQVMTSMLDTYGGDKAWLKGLNIAVRQVQGPVKHFTAHPSSSLNKEVAQSDSDTALMLAHRNGAKIVIEHRGSFVPIENEIQDAAFDATIENLVLMLGQQGASPSYQAPIDNWIATIEEHYSRDLRSIRQEASSLLHYASEIYAEEVELKQDLNLLNLVESPRSPEVRREQILTRLEQIDQEKEYIRLSSRSLAEEMNSWAPDLDSRPGDVAGMARMKARLTKVGLRHDQRLVRMLPLAKTGVWEKALSDATGRIEKVMRQSEGRLKLLVDEVDSVETPPQVLDAVSRNISEMVKVYKSVRSIHQERYDDLRALRREAIESDNFLEEVATRLGISASRPGDIGEQVRFAHDAMQGLVDAFRTGRPIGNKELGRCLAILKMHKEFGLRMFVVAEATAEDLPSISFLLNKVGKNGFQTHGAILRERPEAYSTEAVATLEKAIQNGDVESIRALFIGDSDSRGDGEALAGAVTADTHRILDQTAQSVYRGKGCSKLRGLHTEDGAGERTFDRVIRDGALRIADVSETKDGYKIQASPVAYTTQPHSTIIQLTEGSIGDTRFQSMVTAMFPFERLTNEYSTHIVESLQPAIDASVRVGEQSFYNDIATAMLDRVKDFMATLAKRPNTRSDYTQTVNGVVMNPKEEGAKEERFAERVRAVQQAACEYASPYQSMGLVRQLETFRYIATMDAAEFDVFRESPTGFQFESLCRRYPVLTDSQINYVADEYRHMGVSEESVSKAMDAVRESVSLLQASREKYGITQTDDEITRDQEKLESKEVYAKLARDEHLENGPSAQYFILCTNFLAASGA